VRTRICYLTNNIKHVLLKILTCTRNNYVYIVFVLTYLYSLLSVSNIVCIFRRNISGTVEVAVSVDVSFL